MRLKISLHSKKPFLIPFNYNHIVSSIVYSKIADLELANELHSSNSFKFFTFSQIYIRNRKKAKEGIISKDGHISFQISSPNDYLIKSLIEGYLEDLKINFKSNELYVEKVELLANQEIKNKLSVKTLSPVIARTKKEVNGRLKTWDLNPGDQLFFKSLEKNLLKKYQLFNDTEEIAIDDIKISSEMKFVKRKRIAIEKRNMTTYHRAFMMDLNLEGKSELLKFGYDCGIGEKNSMGFGMIDYIH